MTLYCEDDLIPLSGIQHYAFCPRQWALICLDQIWAENHLTTEGSILHANADNPFARQKTGLYAFVLRAFRLQSLRLGFSGIADVIEIIPDGDAPEKICDIIQQRKFSAIPVEYKRGHRKINDCDRLQSIAQAMIVEEMLDVHVSRAAVFYWEERRREYIEITDTERSKVEEISKEMHSIYASRKIPKAGKNKGCRSCSLHDLCMPGITDRNVNDYIQQFIDNDP